MELGSILFRSEQGISEIIGDWVATKTGCGWKKVRRQELLQGDREGALEGILATRSQRKQDKDLANIPSGLS